MSAEKNKQVVLQFLDSASQRKADSVRSLMREDATFWRCGKPGAFRFAGQLTKREYCDYLETPTPFKDSLRLTMGAITAEEDRVSIEVGLHGVLEENGNCYNNAAHFLFQIRDGKVVSVREYMDTLHVIDVMGS